MFNNQKEAALLATKPHYEVLDGLRGIAAIAVVIFHFMEIAVPDPEKNFIAHAYLAVDFFFVLSGFVIAYAYDERMGSIGVAKFMKLRLIRLHPLVVIGSVLGLLTFIFDPWSNLLQSYAGKAALIFVASCLMVPYPAVPERYFNLFHLNPPTWSLFWEYVANIFYALVLVRLNKKILWVLAIVAAALIVYESYQSQMLSVGWGGDNIKGGAIRVGYSFLIGILAYRSQWIIRTRLGFIVPGLLLLVALMIPFVKTNAWWVDAVIVLFYFPFIVALGAGAKTTTATHAVCKFSGEISYPLYMVHYPFIWLFFSYLEKVKPSMGQITWIIVIGTPLLILFAWLVMKYVDEPVRRYLRKKVRK